MDPLIKVRDLTKDYRLIKKREGVTGGLVDLIRPRKETPVSYTHLRAHETT